MQRGYGIDIHTRTSLRGGHRGAACTREWSAFDCIEKGSGTGAKDVTIEGTTGATTASPTDHLYTATYGPATATRSTSTTTKGNTDRTTMLTERGSSSWLRTAERGPRDGTHKGAKIVHTSHGGICGSSVGPTTKTSASRTYCTTQCRTLCRRASTTPAYWPTVRARANFSPTF